MSKTEASIAADEVDQKAKKSDRPIVVQKSRRWLKVVLGVVAAAALFGGGIFAAGLLQDDEANVVDEAAQSLALQQLVALSESADAVVQQAQGVANVEELQQSGIALQRIAVEVVGLGEQIQDPEIRRAVEELGDGYLKVSVGLVINNGAWTVDGAEKLNQSRDELLAVLGLEAPNSNPAPEPAQTD